MIASIFHRFVMIESILCLFLSMAEMKLMRQIVKSTFGHAIIRIQDVTMSGIVRMVQMKSIVRLIRIARIENINVFLQMIHRKYLVYR